MNTLLSLLKSSADAGYEFIVIGIIVCIALIAIGFVIYAYVNSRKMQAKVITISQPLCLVGYRIESDSEHLEEDDAELWDRYKARQATIQNRKESFSSLSVLQKLDGNRYRYSIGTIVNDFTLVDKDLETFTVPAGIYVDVHISANDTATWKKQRMKARNFILEKWLPESGYEIDDKSEAMEMEYHDKRDAMNTRTIILYYALRRKNANAPQTETAPATTEETKTVETKAEQPKAEEPKVKDSKAEESEKD